MRFIQQGKPFPETMVVAIQVQGFSLSSGNSTSLGAAVPVTSGCKTIFIIHYIYHIYRYL